MKKTLQLTIYAECDSDFQYDIALKCFKGMSAEFNKFFIDSNKKNKTTAIVTFLDQRREVIE